MNWEFVWEATLKRVLIHLSVERLLPNLLAGLVVATISLLFLRYHEVKDKDYIVLGIKQVTLFVFLVTLAVIFISPLPVRGGADVVEAMSTFVALIVLSVASYMDKQTGTIVNGYMVIGIVVNVILCIIGMCLKNENYNGTLVLLFFCCVVVNVFLGLISYTFMDAGLIFMSMCSFAVNDFGNVLFAFLICEVVASVIYLVSALPQVREKMKKHERLRFPFAPSIYVGVVVALFYIC